MRGDEVTCTRLFLSDLIDQVLTLWNDPNKWANAVEGLARVAAATDIDNTWKIVM